MGKLTVHKYIYVVFSHIQRKKKCCQNETFGDLVTNSLRKYLGPLLLSGQERSCPWVTETPSWRHSKEGLSLVLISRFLIRQRKCRFWSFIGTFTVISLVKTSGLQSRGEDFSKEKECFNPAAAVRTYNSSIN